jgi:hemerythrin
MVNWSNELNLGIKEVDDQHKYFLELVNELLVAMQEKKAHTIQEELIDKLIGYAFFHFTKEERILAKNNYPELESHKKQHENFVDKLEKFKIDVENNSLTLNIEMINFMSSWWQKHIRVSDKKYLPYINEHVH